MAKAETTTTRSPRGAKPVSQAFLAALDTIPDASRAAVAKAAQAMIRDELKMRREKTKAAAAKEKARKPVMAKAAAKKAVSKKPAMKKTAMKKAVREVPAMKTAPIKRRARKSVEVPATA